MRHQYGRSQWRGIDCYVIAPGEIGQSCRMLDNLEANSLITLHANAKTPSYCQQDDVLLHDVISVFRSYLVNREFRVWVLFGKKLQPVSAVVIFQLTSSLSSSQYKSTVNDCCFNIASNSLIISNLGWFQVTLVSIQLDWR